MRSLSITLIAVFSAFQLVCAQTTTQSNTSSVFDLAVSSSAGQFAAAGSYVRLHSFGRNGKLQIGYGIRLTSFVGANKFYTTAPAKYTSPRQDLATIFSDNIDQNIDTVTTATTSVFFLNATFNAQYRITSRLDFGLNIDVIGASFGPRRRFNVISSSYDPNQEPVQYGKPTVFNLLLTSDNDIGSLNSEFFIRYWINSRIGIRAGFTFLFSEYRTENDLSFDGGRIMNDRYRHKAGMGMLAVSYKPFN